MIGVRIQPNIRPSLRIRRLIDVTFHFGPGLLAETAAEESDTLVAAAPFTFRQTAKTNFCPQCDDNVNFFVKIRWPITAK